MAANFPGPWELRWYYQCLFGGVTLEHQMRLSVDVDGSPGLGNAMSTYELAQRGGGTVDAETYAEDWADLIAECLEDTAVITHVELWRYTPDTFAADFASVHALSVAGTQTIATVNAGELIITLRSSEGGTGRITLQDTVFPALPTQPAPMGNTAIDALLSKATVGNTAVVLRDNGFPIAGIHTLRGQNEAVFKKRYRP